MKKLLLATIFAAVGIAACVVPADGTASTTNDTPVSACDEVKAYDCSKCDATKKSACEMVKTAASAQGATEESCQTYLDSTPPCE